MSTSQSGEQVIYLDMAMNKTLEDVIHTIDSYFYLLLSLCLATIFNFENISYVFVKEASSLLKPSPLNLLCLHSCTSYTNPPSLEIALRFLFGPPDTYSGS